MRALILAALLAGAAAPAALAQPYGPPPEPAEAPQITVALAPEFTENARRVGIDDGDAASLQKDLASAVRSALRHAKPGAPVRADLTIIRAVPNRPTFRQLGRETSLSLTSVGVGGAEIGGTVGFADGRTVPVSFRWYETDIRQEIAASTWYDADRAFDYFAGTLRRGDLRDHGYGQADKNAGNFGHHPFY